MQDVLNSDFTQFNNWYTVIALLIVVAGIIGKSVIDYFQKKNDRSTMESISIHIQKQSDILDVILKQYSANINADQMEKVFDWVFFQASIKIFIIYHDLVEQLHKGTKVSSIEVENRLKQEILNLYYKDMDDLSKFRYRNVALSEFVDSHVANTVIEFTTTAVLQNKDKRNTKESLEAMFTTIKLGALKEAREVKSNY